MTCPALPACVVYNQQPKTEIFIGMMRNIKAIRAILLAGCLSAIPDFLNAATDSCIGQKAATWNITDVQAWLKICEGEEVDLQAKQIKGSPDHPVTANSLTGSFLRDILSPPLNAAYGKLITIKNATIVGAVALSGIEIPQEVHIFDSTFTDDFTAIGSHFLRSICLQGTSFEKSANFNASVIEGGLYLGNEVSEQRCGPERYAPALDVPRVTFGKLTLDSARVRDDIYLKNFNTSSGLSAINATSGANVILKECSAKDMELRSLSASQQINVVGCEAWKSTNIPDGYAVDLAFAHAKDGVWLNRSKFSGLVYLYAVKSSRINLTGTQLQDLDLSESEVSGYLYVGENTAPGDKEARSTQWLPYDQSTLNLQNSSLEGVAFLASSTAKIPALLPNSITLVGTQLLRLYLGNPREFDDIPLSLSLETYIEFFNRQRPFTESSYKLIGQRLIDDGELDEGRDVLYSGRRSERAADLKQAGVFDLSAYFRWLVSFMLDVTIGYGYHMYRVVFWIIFLLLVGAQVFRTSSPARKYQMPYGIAYSFDMLLPLVQLRKRHTEIELSGWRRYYFYFHKLSGYVLAAFVAAGLSGITK